MYCRSCFRLKAFGATAFVVAGLSSSLGQSDGVVSSGAPDPVLVSQYLPETVVTATRSEAEIYSLPYSVGVVSSADFERLIPRTTPEALREQPSVMVQKTSPGQGSPFLRGFTGFRTLMLIEGIRLNNSTFRDGPNQYWSTVDALSVERMEVVRGPGAVLYGSDAVGGLVNAFMKDPGTGRARGEWHGSAFYRFGSADESHMVRPEFSGQPHENLGVFLGGSLKHFGDLRGGREVGLQPHTGYSEQDLDARVDYRLTQSSWLSYGHQTVRMDDAWRTHSTIYGLAWRGTQPGRDLKRVFNQARDLDFLQYHVEGLEGFAQEVHVSLSHHYQGEAEDRVRASLRRDLQTVDVHTLGFFVQLQSETPVGQLVYGTEYYRDWVDSTSRSYDASGNLTAVRVQGPVADDANYDLAGAFVQDQIDLAGDRLSVILGGRYTFAQVDARRIRHPATGGTFALEESWDNLVGSGRVLYHLDAERHAAVFAGASQGFRAPNLSDLTRWDADWGQEIPTPGVDPETFLSTELGARLNFEMFEAGAVYYHTFFNDMITRVPTGEVTDNGDWVVTKRNSGEGYIHGVELNANVRLHADWNLWSNFTWMRGELGRPDISGQTVTEPVSRLMPTTVNAGLRWSEPRRRFWVELAASFAERQDRLAYNDTLDNTRIPPGGTPGYDVYHLRAGWTPTRHVRLSAALENLTHEDYRIHGSGVNEAGRNFILAAEIGF